MSDRRSAACVGDSSAAFRLIQRNVAQRMGSVEPMQATLDYEIRPAFGVALSVSSPRGSFHMARDVGQGWMAEVYYTNTTHKLHT